MIFTIFEIIFAFIVVLGMVYAIARCMPSIAIVIVLMSLIKKDRKKDFHKLK